MVASPVSTSVGATILCGPRFLLASGDCCRVELRSWNVALVGDEACEPEQQLAVARRALVRFAQNLEHLAWFCQPTYTDLSFSIIKGVSTSVSWSNIHNIFS